MSGPVYSTVQKLWPGQTFICLGSGPSLRAEDVESCRGQARVICVNDAYKLAPWADVLYACDNKWWGWAHKNYKGQHPDFKSCAAHATGQKYTLKPYKGVHLLRHTGDYGLEMDPSAVRTGFNSGYQAVNLAVHLGAARIILLGYDMRVVGKKEHFWDANHGAHPDQTKPPFNACIKAFESLVKPLKAAGVEVINCTADSAIRCFPMARLRDVLDPVAQEVSA